MTDDTESPKGYTRIEVRSTHRFDPVNQCIYCGARDQLSDEHIIPLGLSGNLILPRASCPLCSQMTSRFEGQVLRGFMHDARLAGGFKSRRPRSQPKTIRIRLIDQDDGVTEVDVPRFEAPGFVVLPTFTLPSYLLGDPPVTGINVSGMQLVNTGEQDLAKFARGRGGTGIQTQVVPEIEALAQMLAKIAYSYAVAMTGFVDRESSPLPDLMRDPTTTGRWVGSDQYRLDSEATLGVTHALAHASPMPSPNGPVDVVFIKLFAGGGLIDGYVVVTRAPGWRDSAT
jgi:hypothetical protein